MPHVRERQPFPDEPTRPQPDDLKNPNSSSSGLADLQRDAPRSPGRINEDEAVTGDRAGSTGEAPAGGIPGDDGSLEGGDPA